MLRYKISHQETLLQNCFCCMVLHCDYTHKPQTTIITLFKTSFLLPMQISSELVSSRKTMRRVMEINFFKCNIIFLGRRRENLIFCSYFIFMRVVVPNETLSAVTFLTYIIPHSITDDTIHFSYLTTQRQCDKTPP